MYEQFIFNGRKICYEITIKQVKNINLRVTRNGAVKVSVNRRTGVACARAFVESKASWIASILERQEQGGPKAGMEFRGGGTFLFGGRVCTFAVREAPEQPVELTGDRLLVCLPHPDRVAIEQAYLRWYDQRCRELLPASVYRMHQVFSPLGIPMPEVRLRDMTSRWGSCTAAKGRITLNRHLLKAPPECLDYVSAHELCHLIHQDHSPAFYRVLDSILPDHRERKKLLNRLAAQIL